MTRADEAARNLTAWERMRDLRLMVRLSQEQFGEALAMTRDQIASRENQRTDWRPVELQAAPRMVHSYLAILREAEDAALAKAAAGTCFYCGKRSVDEVVCANAGGFETDPREVCAGCKKKHEF